MSNNYTSYKPILDEFLTLLAKFEWSNKFTLLTLQNHGQITFDTITRVNILGEYKIYERINKWNLKCSKLKKGLIFYNHDIRFNILVFFFTFHYKLFEINNNSSLLELDRIDGNN